MALYISSWTFRPDFMVLDDGSSSLQIYGLEIEQKKLEEDTVVYNRLQEQLKLSPAYLKVTAWPMSISVLWLPFSCHHMVLAWSSLLAEDIEQAFLSVIVLSINVRSLHLRSICFSMRKQNLHWEHPTWITRKSRSDFVNYGWWGNQASARFANASMHILTWCGVNPVNIKLQF